MGDERLDAPEEFLVLELFVAETHQRLECHLVTEIVFARLVEDLRADEPLDQPEQVGIGTPLDLAQRAPLGFRQESELVDLREPIRQEFLTKVEFPAAY